MHRNAKETENLKIEDASVCTVHIPLEMHRSSEATDRQSPQDPESKRKDSIHERISDRPKVNLLQSSKDRLRRRLKEKVPPFLAHSFTAASFCTCITVLYDFSGKLYNKTCLSILGLFFHPFWVKLSICKTQSFWDYGSNGRKGLELYEILWTITVQQVGLLDIAKNFLCCLWDPQQDPCLISQA